LLNGIVVIADKSFLLLSTEISGQLHADSASWRCRYEGTAYRDPDDAAILGLAFILHAP
jgi:hypothetical protein